MMFFTRLGLVTTTLALGASTALAQGAPASASAAPVALATSQPSEGATGSAPAVAPVTAVQPAPSATQPAPVAPTAPQPAAAPPATYYPAYQAYPPAASYPPGPASRPRQKNDSLLVAYNTSVGLGDTHRFAPDFSFLGFSLDWRARVSDHFWPGISLSWQVLYGKEVKTLHYGNSTFNGTIATNLNLFPMLVTGSYYFLTDPRGARPYAGFGIGAYAAEHRLDVGPWTVSEATWHFGFAPELGVALPTGSRTLVVSTKFNYASASGRWDPLMYLNFNVGVEL